MSKTSVGNGDLSATIALDKLSLHQFLACARISGHNLPLGYAIFAVLDSCLIYSIDEHLRHSPHQILVDCRHLTLCIQYFVPLLFAINVLLFDG